MIAVVSLGFALGLLLVFDGVTSRRERRSRAAGALDRLARDSGFRGLSGGLLLALIIGGTVSTFILVAGLTRSIVIAGTLALIVGSWPVALLRGRAEKRARRAREEWPDAIAALIAAIRAGVSLPEACAGLAHRSGEALKPGVDAFTATYRSSGSFATALEQMRRVMADPTADRICVALGLAHTVGGTDLVRVLRTLGDFVRDDLRVRKEIEARWSWTVTAARVAAAAPWIVLLLMSLRPEAAAAYNSSAGVAIILGGAAATLVGYRAMLRAARLPAERRLGA